MKEIRRIKFTGKNLNDVFSLPCVYKIIKVINTPQLVLDTRTCGDGTIPKICLVKALKYYDNED